jgi:2'-5' RNA ligase
MNNKYFIAIVIPQPFQSHIEQLKLNLSSKFNLKGALKSPAHITLHMPFEYSIDKEDYLLNALSLFKFDAELFLEINGFGYFDKRVIYANIVSNKNLNNLYHSLKHFVSSKLKIENEINNLRGFHPHITLAFRDLKKHQFDAVWQETNLFNCCFSTKIDTISVLKFNTVWQVKKNYTLNS